MKRSFDDIVNNLTESINNYDYYVDFVKVFNNVENIEYKVNILNYLLGKEDFDSEFRKVFNSNPEVVEVLPILLAIRDKNLSIFDESIIKYDFSNYMKCDEYLEFIHKTGLINLFKDKRIKNLVDYVTGVEVGLDTNSRKNRTGTLMENLVEKHLLKLDNIEYITQANLKKIKEVFGIDIILGNSDLSINKRFDFVVKDNKSNLFLIETNYYRGSGSKLNETSRSYAKIAEDLKEVENVQFIWITDGQGWEKTKKDFEHAYNSMDHIYTVLDLENNVLENIFNK